MMRDHPEFAHLKLFEEIFKELKGRRTKKILSREGFKSLCDPYSLTKEQKALLAAMLKEKGYDID